MTYKIVRICVLVFTSLIFIFNLRAESTVDSLKTSKKQKNARFSILGGPGYTPDYGILLGGSMLVTFQANKLKNNQPRSVLPLAFAVTLAKGGGLSTTLRPQIFLSNDKIRLTGQFLYKNNPDNFYGVGYETNKNTERGLESSGYEGQSIQINPNLLVRIAHSKFYIGPMIDFNYDQMNKLSTGVYNQNELKPFLRSDSTYEVISNGIGISASYDTRDIPSNAYKGIYFDLKTVYYGKFVGSEYNFGSIAIDYRQYVALPTLGPRRILTWTVSTKNSFGNVPPTRLQFLGSPFDLRGYYNGQFRDKSAHTMVAEYRHMFNPTGQTKFHKLWSRLGVAGWAGLGLMGPSPVKIEGILPNAGLGLRIQLQPRMNFRLDVGHGFGTKQTLIYFNMTEAF